MSVLATVTAEQGLIEHFFIEAIVDLFLLTHFWLFYYRLYLKAVREHLGGGKALCFASCLMTPLNSSVIFIEWVLGA